jgi:hypothetical protein
MSRRNASRRRRLLDAARATGRRRAPGARRIRVVGVRRPVTPGGALS